MSPLATDRTTRDRMWVALLLVLFGAVFAQGLGWGLPSAWDYDEITARQLHGALYYGPHGQWPVRYPLAHMYVLDVTSRFAVYLDRLRMSFAGATPITVDLRTAYAIRWTNVAMALGTLLLVRCTAMEVFRDRRAARFALAAAGLNLPMFYYAKTGNLDIPYLLWSSAALWFYVRALRHRRLLDHLLLGAAVALSVATKDQAYGLWLLAPFPIAFVLRQEQAARGRRFPLVAALGDVRVLGPLAVAVLLFLSAQGMWRDPRVLRDHIAFLSGPDIEWARTFERTFLGVVRMTLQAWVNLRWSMGLPLLAVSLGGLLLALTRPRSDRWLSAALLVPIVSYYLGFFCRTLFHVDRYFLPLFLVLGIFAGRAFAHLTRLPGGLGIYGRVLVTLVIAWSATRAHAINRLMLADTRVRIETWAEATAPGKVFALGLENFPLLPRLPRLRFRDAIASDGAIFAESDADFVVVDTTSVVHGYGAREPLFLERMRHREVGVFLVHREDPQLFFDTIDFDRCFENATSNLCYVSPTLEAFGVLRGSWVDWARTEAKGDAHELGRFALEERDLGRLDNARLLAEEALCLVSGEPAALEVMALDAIDAGQLGRAENLLLAALETDPARAAILLARARILYAQQRHRAAQRDTAEAAAVAVVARDASTLLAIATMLQLEGEPSLAMTMLDEIERPLRDPIHGKVAALYHTLAAPTHVLRAYLRWRPLAWGWRPPTGWVEDLAALDLSDSRLPTTMGPRGGKLPPPVVRSGVYGTEPGDDGELFRWSQDRVAITVEGPPRLARIEVEFACTLGVDQVIELHVAGSPRTSIRCSGHQNGKLTAVLQPADWGGEAFAPIELQVTPTRIPAESLGTDDTRRLGVRLRTIKLLPV